METERFRKAYNALLGAYFNGKLGKGDCTMCAVGNICKEPAEKLGVLNHSWKDKFFTDGKGNSNYANVGEIITKSGIPLLIEYLDKNEQESARRRLINAETLIKHTGYSQKELARIEKAFERNTKINVLDYSDTPEQDILNDQFNGLNAVIDVLVELDNIPNETKSYNNKFKEHPKLQLS